MESPTSSGGHMEKGQYAAQGTELNRQMTVALSPEQYERLFFQPTPAKGDLAKRLGNPTLLGLLGFLVPFSTTMFCLLNFQGSSIAGLAAVGGSFYFFGGICMVIAGLCEFILGNTYPFVVFIIYGAHWVNTGFTGDPAHPASIAYGADGATSVEFTAGQGIYCIVMLLVSFVFTLGSLRTNVPFVIVFVCLDFLFGFFAAGYFDLGRAQTAAEVAHAVRMFEIAGGFGFVAAVMGWYLAIITACASTGVPCPLPIFDLSTKVFRGGKAAAQEHAGSVQQPATA